MRAVIYEGTPRLDQNVPEPQAEPGQVLLRLRRAGICNTDLELMRGMYGFSGIPGHEFVADVMGGDNEWLGRRVVGEINVACGNCDFCQRGIPSQCRNRSSVGIRNYPGAFADYLALTVDNLHAVPDSVADDKAVFTEPLAAALQITESVHISPRDRVMVVGIGKLGILCAQVLKLTGADVIGIVRREAQARLLNALGIPAAGADDLPPQRAQVVVDCTGNADGLKMALKLVESRGSIVLKSTYNDMPAVDMTQIAVREIKVVGSRCGPFGAALRLLAAGLIETAPLIEARYPFEAALTALDHAARPGAMKILLDF
jgi:threonine dehydrogenase-like Zn-dependent dehydrogenase